jgi:hypothetical protein
MFILFAKQKLYGEQQMACDTLLHLQERRDKDSVKLIVSLLHLFFLELLPT